ncbi:type II secretion system F family protein [Streptomyces sp. NPDC001262]|uniref:type II secretion system F family protein n=1 Tax=unclassified Streptomyces TaxID=2593676 RepID=UPI00369F1162
MTAAGVSPQAVSWCVALICAAAAAAALSRPGREVRRARLLFAGGGTAGVQGPAPWLWPRVWLREGEKRLRRAWQERREWVCLPLGCLVALLGHSVLPLLAGVLAVPLVRRWLAARARQREREAREAAVIDLCGTVAGDLRAGKQPGEAVAEAGREDLGPGWAGVPAAARFGGDVPAALRKAGSGPGTQGLNGVAACWRVAVDGGAGLASGLERVAAALAAERDQREDLQAQLAGTRSTAVMLAVLPVLALLMGTALGAAPLRVLLHTPAGLGCLAFGGLLEWAGLVWTGRIVRSAAGESGGGGRA